MYYRMLGQSAIEVSEIGFGGWAIGGDAWGKVQDVDSLAAMERAFELGVTFFDTADVYGSGHSEELVASVFQKRRNEIVIATKGGLMGHHRNPMGEPVYDRPEKVIAAFEQSLRRLNTDFIDVYFCHLWWNKPAETDAFMRAFDTLKRSGKLRLAGVSTNDLDYIKYFNQDGGIDVVHMDYSILNRKPEIELLPYCEKNGVGAVARGALKMGLLTGKFSKDSVFPDGDVRTNWPNEPWFTDDLRAVENLRSLVDEKLDLTQLALRYVLQHPALSVAIPGAKTASQVDMNTTASRRPFLSQEMMAQIDLISAQ